MIKVSIILGTRPEAVKLAPVILALRQHPYFITDICTTSQHREMLTPILKTFEIAPDVDLEIMQPDQSLADLTARVLVAVEKYLKKARPDLVILQGDTTTVLASALAAFYCGIAVGHVEAGMRSWNMLSPWPEEANRVLVARLVSLHFAPIEENRQNLLKEGIGEDGIFVTGNPLVDALKLAIQLLDKAPVPIPGIAPDLLSANSGRRLVLITSHRRESFGSGLESICRAIDTLAQNWPEIDFVYPVHLNPHVREPVYRILGHTEDSLIHSNIHLIEPLSYLPFVSLLRRADLVLTDSGGVQEEAVCLGKPTLTMRTLTERPEAVAAGTVKLVGNNYSDIVRETHNLLANPQTYNQMSKPFSPYIHNQSPTQRIIDACITWSKRKQ